MKKTKNMIGVFVSILLFLFIFGVVIDQLEQWKNKKIFSQRVPSGMYDKFFKRPIDIVLSLIALVIFFPIMLSTAIMIKINLGSPIFFKQRRPGLNGEIFELWKFRSMTEGQDKNGNMLSDSERLSDFGRKLRSTSIDELPELINIIKGDMAIIGPRPQLIKDMVFMSAEQRKRHTVRPGLSGLAQVSGRNAIVWERKLSLDLEYIKKITFLGDMNIIFRTIYKVIRCEDITDKEHATALDYGDYLLNKNIVSQEKYNELQELAKRM